MMTPAERWLAAYGTLAAHGIRLNGHDLSLEAAEAIAAIADRRVSPAGVPGAKTLTAAA